MKIKCPKCQNEIYTNPFAFNKEMKCPFCQAEIQLSEKTILLLRSFVALDVIGDAVVCGIISSFFSTSQAAMAFFFFVLIGYMFELPQRSLQQRGLLIYELKSSKNDSAGS